jgi:hypothetical protein
MTEQEVKEIERLVAVSKRVDTHVPMVILTSCEALVAEVKRLKKELQTSKTEQFYLNNKLMDHTIINHKGA